MSRRLLFLSLSTAIALVFCSCESTDDAASLVLPDRDKEGLTGPGIRMQDNPDVGTNTLQRASGSTYAPTSYLQKQQNAPVDGIDFFQYKQKF